MPQIVVRVDDELKKEAAALFNELGLDMTTAVKLFLKQSVLTRSIPFEVKLDLEDNKNQKHWQYKKDRSYGLYSRTDKG